MRAGLICALGRTFFLHFGSRKQAATPTVALHTLRRARAGQPRGGSRRGARRAPAAARARAFGAPARGARGGAGGWRGAQRARDFFYALGYLVITLPQPLRALVRQHLNLSAQRRLPRRGIFTSRLSSKLPQERPPGRRSLAVASRGAISAGHLCTCSSTGVPAVRLKPGAEDGGKVLYNEMVTRECRLYTVGLV